MPEVRIGPATEDTLSKCLKHGVWAGRKALPNNWKKDQVIIVRIESYISAIGIVLDGETETNSELIGEGFPKVLKVKWVWSAEKIGERVETKSWYRDLMESVWGPNYGYRSLNQTPLPLKESKIFLKEIQTRQPSTNKIIEALLKI
ncbi:MAG: hypothetical protein IV090_26575 [Candidatus Sericytochromatia bacterium]|nr:hypothetical protein [Candidatus Sericytochromatia bacterium]